jgi:hypothetical protein
MKERISIVVKKNAEKKKTNERREKEAKCIEKNEGEKVIL